MGRHGVLPPASEVPVCPDEGRLQRVVRVVPAADQSDRNPELCRRVTPDERCKRAFVPADGGRNEFGIGRFGLRRVNDGRCVHA